MAFWHRIDAEAGEDDGSLAYQYRRARKTWGSWVFGASCCLGILLALLRFQERAGASVDFYGLGGMALEAALVFFLAYHMFRGRAWIGGAVLLALYALEIVFKLMEGTLSPGWAIFHAACVYSIFKGWMACVEIRSIERNGVSLETEALSDTFD